MMLLVERLVMGSGAGLSGSFLTSLSVSGVSATDDSSARVSRETLNQGVTQMYLIVNRSLSNSLIGNRNRTEMAKNWNVMYCSRLVRSRSLPWNSPGVISHALSRRKEVKSEALGAGLVISRWKNRPPTRKMRPTTIAPKIDFHGYAFRNGIPQPATISWRSRLRSNTTAL